MKVPLFIIIFPRLSRSSSSGEDLIASPVFEVIVNFPPLNFNKPSDAIAVLFALIVYSPFDETNIIDVWDPPLIIFLQSPFNLKSFLFWNFTLLFFFIFIVAHSPVVVDESS